MSCFPIAVPGELETLSFHKLRVDMNVNKTRFERNSFLEHYHLTCIGKTKYTSQRGVLLGKAFSSLEAPNKVYPFKKFQDFSKFLYSHY